MSIAKWAFACEGKRRQGDPPVLTGIHVWKRHPDGTATCKKCGDFLTMAEAIDCFTERR